MQYSVIFQDKKSGQICDLILYEGKSADYIRDHSQELLIDCDEDAIIEKTVCISQLQFSQPDMEALDPAKLYPVIAMDENGEILMYAFANNSAILQTAESGYACYYSRSRKKQWKKGEDSGHVQEIIKILYQKDKEFFLYRVKQKTAACHTGYYSCFYRRISNNAMETVFEKKIFNPKEVY